MEEFYADIRELDPFLGPYPYESYRRWQKLTSHISEKVVDKVLQNRNLNTMMSGSQNDLPVFSSDYLKDETFDLGVDSKGKGPKTTNEARCTEKNKDENTRIIFTSIDLRRSIPQNPSNEELAKYGMDKSHLLRSLINNEFSSKINVMIQVGYNNLLGELQLAYLALLTAFNYDGFEQWKKIVALICYSEEAINQIPDLFENFISILRVQLEGKKDDFMVDLFSSENFLNESLMFFKETIDDTNLPELKKKWLKLEKHLKTQFGWSFVEENCI
ncbi:hypothetical protein ROZALSC1DRAFT_27428 [Rozella allomycis CSF55]|uniref:Uncharacterized protein n=1 Tax=Rozella allomycis (strain CSF55) TaxID=988480 RepID=A0A4P9YN50_ROZAC|nr:hypothetical protein ROZALSC1DRAFT_27428 [Rozella allomycis CSF55]